MERGDGDGWSLGSAGRFCLPGEGGDNDPRSCLGSLSVVSAKTPISFFTTLLGLQCFARRGYLARFNFLPKKEGPAVRLL